MTVTDPADKTLDASADGAFGGKPTNRRAGYGDQLDMILRVARKGGTLAAGEGKLIVEYYEERLSAIAAALAEAREENERMLTTLRESSEAIGLNPDRWWWLTNNVRSVVADVVQLRRAALDHASAGDVGNG